MPENGSNHRNSEKGTESGDAAATQQTIKRGRVTTASNARIRSRRKSTSTEPVGSIWESTMPIEPPDQIDSRERAGGITALLESSNAGRFQIGQVSTSRNAGETPSWQPEMMRMDRNMDLFGP